MKWLQDLKNKGLLYAAQKTLKSSIAPETLEDFKRVFLEARFNKIDPKHPPLVIVDVEAETGMFSRLMNGLYPEADIHALEYNNKDFKFLETNVKDIKFINIYKIPKGNNILTNNMGLGIIDILKIDYELLTENLCNMDLNCINLIIVTNPINTELKHKFDSLEWEIIERKYNTVLRRKKYRFIK
jgi:hypothetical protein